MNKVIIITLVCVCDFLSFFFFYKWDSVESEFGKGFGILESLMY